MRSVPPPPDSPVRRGQASATTRLAALAVLAALVAALVGPVDPVTATPAQTAADATVVGTVVDGDGTPLAGVPVAVQATDSGLGFLADGLFLTAFIGLTAGLGLVACISDPGFCKLGGGGGFVDGATTGADGAYSATLPRSYVAGKETDTDWVVGAELAPRAGEVAGAASSFEFEVNIQTQEAPPLPMWHVAPTVSTEGSSVRVDGSAGPTLQSQAVEIQGGYVHVRGGGDVASFDTRLLEPPAGDAGGSLVAYGSGTSDVRVNHANGRTIYHQRVRSASVPVAPGPVPGSRGAACAVRHGDGSPALDHCALTDGDLKARIAPATEQERDPFAETTTTVSASSLIGDLLVDLVEPVELDLVVLHGPVEAEDVRVEASADGVTWTPLAVRREPTVVSGTKLLATPGGVVEARYIHVVGRDLSGIAELSVWDRPPTPAGGAPAAGPGSGRDADDRDGGGLDGSSSGWAALAVLLIVGVGLALHRQSGRTGAPPA